MEGLDPGTPYSGPSNSVLDEGLAEACEDHRLSEGVVRISPTWPQDWIVLWLPVVLRPKLVPTPLGLFQMLRNASEGHLFAVADHGPSARALMRFLALRASIASSPRGVSNHRSVKRDPHDFVLTKP